MISDAKKIPLNIVTKHFFSCRKIFFLATRTFFLLQEKNCFVTLSRGIFLASEKKM